MNKSQPVILIVEDEPKVASFIKKGLQENGFSSEIAFDGSIAQKIFDSGNFDLIILDINLPVKNGIEVCKEIRSKNKKIPILMLTAMGTTEDKLDGFEAGADDYLLKPFEFRELLARIRALLKRGSFSGMTERILRFQDLEMNLDTYVVIRGNKKIDLSPKEFALLEFMLKNKERVLSRSDIAEKVWDNNFETGTNVIDVYVNFLRKKIDRDFKQKLIHTQMGVGYILKAVSE